MIPHPAPLRADRTTIIVPLTAAELDGLRAECAAIAALGEGVVDMVEWRVDRFDVAARDGEIGDALAAIRSALPGMPVLATYRTPAEENRPDLRPDAPATSPDHPEAYVDLVARLAAAEGVALVDVERAHPRAADALAACHARGTAVVLSEHHFTSAASVEAVRAAFAAMEDAGADVGKLAVMPASRAEVTALVHGTALAAETASIPLIGIAMGALGRVSRIAAPAFGSAASYCTVGEASAPGQVPATEARRIVDQLAAPEEPGPER